MRCLAKQSLTSRCLFLYALKGSSYRYEIALYLIYISDILIRWVRMFHQGLEQTVDDLHLFILY